MPLKTGRTSQSRSSLPRNAGTCSSFLGVLVENVFPQETNLQSIESVLSSLSHQLLFPLSAESKFRDSLKYYRKRAANNEEFVPQFLAQYGEDKLAHFRQEVLGYRSAPVPPSQFLKYFFLQYASIINRIRFYSFTPNFGEFAFTSTKETSNWRIWFENGDRWISWCSIAQTCIRWRKNDAQCLRTLLAGQFIRYLPLCPCWLVCHKE